MTLVEKIIACHEALDQASISHAFGGALALAWCTRSARGTIDIDLNVFVEPSHASTVLGALPASVERTDSALEVLESETQIRLWWENTPLDIFLNSTPFHEEVSKRVVFESFSGHSLPFLGCNDLAVFKAFFDRTQDWADLEAMAEAGTLSVADVQTVLVGILGPDDERIDRLRSLPD